jgi:hypothetical protein
LYLSRARDGEACRTIVHAWIEAVGGTVEGRSFRLPPNLPKNLALAELRGAAERCGLTVITETASRRHVPPAHEPAGPSTIEEFRL